jgi:hypothetical protein
VSQPVRAAGTGVTATAGVTFAAPPTSGTQSFIAIQTSRTIAAGPPVAIAADAATDTGGATTSVDWGPSGPTAIRLSLGNSALGVSNVSLGAPVDPTCNALCIRQVTLPDGRKLSVALETRDGPATVGTVNPPPSGDFSWTIYGFWNIGSTTNVLLNQAYFVSGFETPNSGIPTTGQATFNGIAQGNVAQPNGANVAGAYLSGSAQLQANFATGTITGTATGMTATPGGTTVSQPWNNLAFAGTFTQGVNGFSGTSSVSNAPGNSFSMLGSATGYLTGRFFGPQAQEVGAIWNVYDGTRAAAGYLVAK